jgi:hypothetical protein
MSSQLRTVTISAPGFYGLNTQEGGVALEPGWALLAENCVIDRYGRIGSRKGWEALNSSSTPLGTARIRAMHEFIDNSNNSYTLVAGNNKLFRLASGVLTEITYGGGGAAPTITASDWHIAHLANKCYFFQLGHEPLVFDPTLSTTTYRRVSELASYQGTVPQANVCISAYGRLWAANTSGNKYTVYWSDTANGANWQTGTAGYLDLTNVWVDGADQVVGLAAIQNYLIIFGKSQVLTYQNAIDPTELSLKDAMANLGCLGRDTIVNKNNDVLFLTEAGVRSFQRTITQDNMPLSDVSKNVRDELLAWTANETDATMKAGYSPKDAMYVVSLLNSSVAYCFDTRALLENGSYRTTTWTGDVPSSYYFDNSNRFLLGKPGFVGNYANYTDNGEAYRMVFHTNFFDGGTPTNLKMMKKIVLTTIIGAGTEDQQLFGKWAYDYSNLFKSTNQVLPQVISSYYNVDEYGVGVYSAGNTIARTVGFNTSGSGKVIQLGFEAVINNNSLTIQKIDVYTKLGKTL